MVAGCAPGLPRTEMRVLFQSATSRPDPRSNGLAIVACVPIPAGPPVVDGLAQAGTATPAASAAPATAPSIARVRSMNRVLSLRGAYRYNTDQRPERDS